MTSAPLASICGIANALIKQIRILWRAPALRTGNHIVVQLSSDNLSCSHCLSGDTANAILLCANHRKQAPSGALEKRCSRRVAAETRADTRSRFFHVVVPLDSVLSLFHFPSRTPRPLPSVYTGLISIHPVARQFFSTRFLLRHEQNGNILYIDLSKCVPVYSCTGVTKNISGYRMYRDFLKIFNNNRA